MSGSWRPARSSAAMRGANSRAQNSRTVCTSCSWSGVRARSSTSLQGKSFYFDGEGVGQATAVGVALGEGLAFAGEVLAVGDGVGQPAAGVGTDLRSFGPTWPITGSLSPMLRMIGTILELCS